MIRQRAHRNESLGGLRGQYKTKNALHSRNRSIFSGRKLGLYQQSLTARSIFEHASICSPSQFAHLHGKHFCIDLFAFTIRSPAWETAPKIVSPSRNPSDFDLFLSRNSQIDARLHGSSNGYASMGTEASTGTDLLFALISTAELWITRAISERHHARVTSQLFGPEVFTSVFF